jgi:hypothetical protein
VVRIAGRVEGYGASVESGKASCFNFKLPYIIDSFEKEGM